MLCPTNLDDNQVQKFTTGRGLDRSTSHSLFERQWNSFCLISLVKAIRVRVQSLANSLVVRNPDHFFMQVRNGNVIRREGKCGWR